MVATGGCGNLSYLWSNGSTAVNQTGLTPGLYVVTVTDNNGNTSTASIVLTQAALLTATVTTQNVTCFGANNGTATANGVGGCAPYTYRWSNNATTQTISGLRPGSYSVTITDGYGCTATASGVVTQPTRLIADAGAHQVVYPAYGPQACATLTGTVSGGTAAYNTRWTTRSGQVLATGNTYSACPTVTTVYFFRVTDANGCSAVDSVAVCPRSISCGNNRIQICHNVPGRNACSQTQCVPVSQVASHLGHGDVLGACGGSRFNCTFPRSNHGNGGSGSDDKTASHSGASSDDQMVSLSLRAFPNPTNGALTVELACQACSEDMNYAVKVSDIYGQLLAEVEVTVSAGEATAKLDLSQFASGVYLISVTNGDQRLVERVVKQ
ncbi:MAG: T9SS type A sorting domain-containing protein [Bacteroidetes bacterium]|nr:T9SS type A sorting domain-containing protein [Bacteroidota bacterium]